jgi:Replication protein
VRERAQRTLWREDDDHKETIRSKLDGLLETNQFFNFARCGREQVFRTCRGCRAVEVFDYRCSLKWCPRCQWFLTERRKKILGLWASRISQPKHLVLTQKNFPTLTRKKIREHTRALSKMRRAKCFNSVKGGCVSVEITHEGRGWHVHSHWLLDVRWLDMPAVSQSWGHLVGQEYAICKVMDVRERSYLQEVTKYVCEGSAMSRWAPELILEFVTAIRGRRFFFPFGSLFKLGRSIREEIAAGAPGARACGCGCCDFIIETETSAVLAEVRRGKQVRDYVPRPARAAVASPGGGSQHKEAGHFLFQSAPSRKPVATGSSCDGVGPRH